MIDIFMRSPLANTLAVIVLIALIIAVLISIILSTRDIPIPLDKGGFTKLLPAFSILGIPATLDLLQTNGIAFLFALIVFIVFILNIIIPILKISGKASYSLVRDWYKWSILISTIGGLAITGYITFVESVGAPITCGSSNGCSAVQNSRYSVLFDFLPVGVVGLVGYFGILTTWIAMQIVPDAVKRTTALAIWAMCIFGVLFSTYLTFLEPFVIGATCMWCISSAVLMIILLLASTPAAQQAFVMTDD
jgi:uncharacterized membrane protein